MVTWQIEVFASRGLRKLGTRWLRRQDPGVEMGWRTMTRMSLSLWPRKIRTLKGGQQYYHDPNINNEGHKSDQEWPRSLEWRWKSVDQLSCRRLRPVSEAGLLCVCDCNILLEALRWRLATPWEICRDLWIHWFDEGNQLFHRFHVGSHAFQSSTTSSSLVYGINNCRARELPFWLKSMPSRTDR